jgi:hypothetical protein
MTPVVAGFWGAFFGAAALMALGSLLAFIRTRHRVPLRAAPWPRRRQPCAVRLRQPAAPLRAGQRRNGRLVQDGFLLLAREHEDPARRVEIVLPVAQRTVRPVSLSTMPATSPGSMTPISRSSNCH